MSYQNLRRRGGPTRETMDRVKRWSERLPKSSDRLTSQRSSGRQAKTNASDRHQAH